MIRIQSALFLLLMSLWPAMGWCGAEPAKNAAAPDAAGQKGTTVHLLTVGNSFSHNAMHYLPDLAKADGNTLELTEANIGGASMEVHWTRVQQHEADPADKRGFYFAQKGLKELLAGQKWDYVTIQQASIKSHDLATYRPFAGELRDYITRHAPQAEIMIHETWEYRVDDPRFAVKTPKPGEPLTQKEMYQHLSAAYRTIAEEQHERLIPVGDAFHLADTDLKWGYRPDTKFDLKHAVSPALPDQTHSLHVGWKWVKPTKGANGDPVLRMDGHHASTAGEYLGGCVFYEVLFKKSPVGNPFVPPGIDAEYARFLQETAHKAIEQSQAKRAGAVN